MVFVSAGHHAKDSGAVANGYQENKLTMELRDMVVPALKRFLPDVTTDIDSETLGEYLKRIKTGNGSVVCEFHFDAANGKASGTTALVGDDADRLDKMFAAELCGITSEILGIPNRGVKSESESHRGRLGLMRETGTVALLEVCFIDNVSDMAAYQAKKAALANAYAAILYKYEKLI